MLLTAACRGKCLPPWASRYAPGRAVVSLRRPFVAPPPPPPRIERTDSFLSAETRNATRNGRARLTRPVDFSVASDGLDVCSSHGAKNGTRTRHLRSVLRDGGVQRVASTGKHTWEKYSSFVYVCTRRYGENSSRILGSW